MMFLSAIYLWPLLTGGLALLLDDTLVGSPISPFEFEFELLLVSYLLPKLNMLW